MENIKFYNLSDFNKKYEKYFLSSFKKINSSGRYLIGDYVNRFENELAKFCKAQYAVGVGNCVDAIKLSFMALKITKHLKGGDEVIVPANTYVASVIGILSANLIPALVDADIDTFNLDVDQLRKKISKKTKAILIVDLYGHPPNVEEIKKIANKYSLKIVHDAAQSLGAGYKKKMVGSLFNITCFSFFPGKNLGAFGDAGAITTNNKKISQILKSLRNYGEQPFKNLKDRKYINNYIGVNSRLDEIQAAVLLKKLKDFGSVQKIRKSIANYYNNKIINKKIVKPITKINYQHSWHLFVIRCKYRNKLKKFLKKNKIETMLHYPKPFYKQPAFKKLKFKNLPVTEKIYREILSIPLHPTLKKREIQYIVNTLNKFS